MYRYSFTMDDFVSGVNLSLFSQELKRNFVDCFTQSFGADRLQELVEVMTRQITQHVIPGEIKISGNNTLSSTYNYFLKILLVSSNHSFTLDKFSYYTFLSCFIPTSKQQEYSDHAFLSLIRLFFCPFVRPQFKTASLKPPNET